MESLWVYEGPFSKTVIFPVDFNHFIRLRSEVEVDVVLLWGHFWHMKVTLNDSGLTLAPLCGHLLTFVGPN